MPTLTDQIFASGISLNDFVHIARPTDYSQSDNGSSYKATIAQLIDSENCCLTSGIYTVSAGTIDFYGLTNQVEFSVSGITVFTGGSSNCINNFYTNNIISCNEDLFVQPNGVSGQDTFFGKDSAASGFTITHITENDGIGGPNSNITKLGLNNLFINSRSTIELYSYDKSTSIRFYDNLVSAAGFFKNFQEYIVLSYSNTVSNSMTLNSNNECGIMIGAISSSDNSNGDYGVPDETFISTIFSANGINFISTSDTDNGGFIRFFAGCSPDNIDCAGKPHIHINGSGTTKGFMSVGQGSSNPTSWLDICFENTTNGYQHLRLRTSYTPTSSSDSNGNIGEISWDDDYLYVKSSISPHTWNRISLSTF